MKKLLSIVMASVLLGSMVSCAHKAGDSSASTTPAPVTAPALPDDYNIMMLLSEDGGQYNPKFTFRKSFSEPSRSRTQKESKYVGTTKQLEGDDRVFTYYESEIRYTNPEYPKSGSDQNQKGSHYAHFLTYQSEDHTELTFLADTDLVVWYRSSHSPNSSDCKTFSDEELTQIAEECILQYVSKAKFDTLTLEDISTDILGRYSVRYRRRIEEYLTEETIIVHIEKDGVVECMDARGLYMLDGLPYLISKRNLDAASNYLREQIDALGLANLTYSPFYLTTDGDGNIYLEQIVRFTDLTGEPDMQVLFINVN